MTTTKTTVSAIVATVLAAGALGVSATGAAAADANTAHVTTQMATRAIAYVGAPQARPAYVGLDLDGDRKTDTHAYCVEPGQPFQDGVLKGSQPLARADFGSAQFADKHGVQWVAQNSFPAVSVADLAKQANVSVGSNAQQAEMVAASATQAALYKFTNGYSVVPNFRIDGRDGGEAALNNAMFWGVYNYLVTHAHGQLAAGAVQLWDNAPGQSATQTLIEVPNHGTTPTPTPTPSKTTPTPPPSTSTPSRPTPTDSVTTVPSRPTGTAVPTAPVTTSAPKPVPTKPAYPGGSNSGSDNSFLSWLRGLFG